ncbi:UPF0223 family protein [Ectobacillus sp. JY-23]|uniref:UPF0223 family protein n=1 Tax=Ectobacillus sp. JY-23 TaxID=2933872 RepID=UPI001FF5217F|nr:UPF0223 family protein [Ectobacillus sp. JY-23]UOY93779.1 UPF0223 family protein [Ectobacillus sp. JY-23]
MEYQYPMDYTWSTDEIIDVIHFYEGVEKAYEAGLQKDVFMRLYRRFKEIVPSKAEEKKLCNEFEEMSGYSAYRVVQAAKLLGDSDKIKM